MGFRQFELAEIPEGELDPTEDTVLMCWMEDDERLKPGVRVTLKAVPGLWEVVHRYEVVLDAAPRRVWRVGGLT